jgi:hypothetical protein
LQKTSGFKGSEGGDGICAEHKGKKINRTVYEAQKERIKKKRTFYFSVL